jgi:hypothetical protein
VNYIMRQIIRTKGQEMNRCWTVSFEPQKQHFIHPFHLRLTKLSFVSNTLPRRSHIKILILRGSFSFHRYLCRNRASSFIKSRYIDFTVKTPLLVNFRANLSCWYEILTVINCWHKLSQSFHLLPFRILRNSIFNGLCVKTSATRTFFLCTNSVIMLIL